MRFTAGSLVLLLVGAAVPAAAQSKFPSSPARWQERVYYGGSVGLGFGDIDYVQISPQVGFHVTPRISTGLAAFYLSRSYSSPIDESTHDFGFDVFGRYRVVPPVFVQAQYSYTDFEYPLVSGTVRDSYSAVLAGVGFVQPLGGRAVFVVTALYDFTYSDSEPAPYDDPWLLSAGVAFGF